MAPIQCQAVCTALASEYLVLVYLDIYGQVIISLMLVDKYIYSIVCLKS